MADPKVLGEGKFKIQTVGPVKEGVSKKTNKPWKVFDIQFYEDANWYATFWTDATPPAVDQELTGKKEWNEEFKNYQFNMGFAGAKQNWNPSGANSTLVGVAAQIVHDAFELGMTTVDDWNKRAKAGESMMQHYLRTVVETATLLKPEVTKLGGGETKVAETTSSTPTGEGDPGPVPPGTEDWPSGQEPVELGPM